MEQSTPLGWIETLARLPVSTVILSMVVFTVIRIAAVNWHTRLGRFISDFADAIIYAGILVYLVVRPFVAQPFYIPSESMVPTLQVGDLVMVGKFNYRIGEPQRGDIVVFRAPDHALNPGQIPGKTDFIKRLIGKPGDVIEIKSGEGVYRNGQLLKEPYVSEPPNYSMKILNGNVYSKDSMGFSWYEGGNGIKQQEVTDPELQAKLENAPSEPIPPGKYLVLGDNRPFSSDGHHWGLLESHRVVGKALFVFFPFGRIGIPH